MLEYAIIFMENVGPFLLHRKEEAIKLDGYISYIEKFKDTLSNRVKFMIIDLMELRDKKWVSEKINPMTLLPFKESKK
uniref:Uncharacterized protein n=1 Tax=Panagrolaimus davidi TaxID=227884 RepID=A0A914QLJ6_9BILA